LKKKKHLTQLAFGSFGLKSLENGRITMKQLETLRRGLSRYIKKNTAQLWFRQKPLFPITQKPTEIRMGKGKGSIFTHIIRLRAGSVFCEIEGILPELAIELLRVLATKLGVRTVILSKRRYF